MSFSVAIDSILILEGGYANDVADRGGQTRYGITDRIARAHGYTGPMAELSLDAAKEIYKKAFWDKNNLEQVSTLSPAIAFELFESGVNCGPSVAARWLQQALNGCNIDRRTRKKRFTDLKVDGVIGKQTLQALAKAVKSDEALIFSLLNIYQGARYATLAASNASQRVFLSGWITKRVRLSPRVPIG